jgi:arabinan endo-1,5-alpha-L-arabinosidase
MEYNNNWLIPAVDAIEGVILKGNASVVGPGHNGQIITDNRGDEWFIYHAILLSDPWLPGGATRRPMFLDRIEWISGWPVINKGMGPSTELQQKPYFEN